VGAAVEEGTSVGEEGDAVEVAGAGVRVAAKVACSAAAVAWIGDTPSEVVVGSELPPVAVVGEEPPHPRIASDTSMTIAANNFIGEPLGDSVF
jgi:hypothetical protein